MEKFGVAVKAIIFDGSGRVLILKKSLTEDISPGSYDFPGGRVKFGESLEGALIRETFEETGYTVKPLLVFNAWGFLKNDLHLAGIEFLCKLEGGLPTLSEEHSSGEWLKPEDLSLREGVPDWMLTTVKKACKLRETAHLLGE